MQSGKMNILKGLTLLFVAGLLFGCSSRKPADVEKPDLAGPGLAQSPPASGFQGGPGGSELQIAPAAATKGSTIWIVSREKRIDESAIRWLVNGVLDETAAGYVFKSAGLNKGDKVQVQAAMDGREALSNVIEIQDAPPEISDVRFAMPDPADPLDRVGAEVVASDADGDGLTIAYEWTKNGEPAGNEKKIAGPVRRGDKIVLKVMADDGEKKGRVVVLHREILNLPPVVSQSDDFRFDGKTWTHQVLATDPDGDALSYSLRNAPPGMTINTSTGFITWAVPKDVAGKAAVTAVVNDGHGGEVTRVLNIEIRGR